MLRFLFGCPTLRSTLLSQSLVPPAKCLAFVPLSPGRSVLCKTTAWKHRSSPPDRNFSRPTPHHPACLSPRLCTHKLAILLARKPAPHLLQSPVRAPAANV